jgi:hypothetical protein
VHFEFAGGTFAAAIGALHAIGPLYDEFVTLTTAERFTVEFGLHDHAGACADVADHHGQRRLHRSRRQLNAIDLGLSHCAVREIRERRCDGARFGVKNGSRTA